MGAHFALFCFVCARTASKAQQCARSAAQQRRKQAKRIQTAPPLRMGAPRGPENKPSHWPKCTWFSAALQPPALACSPARPRPPGAQAAARGAATALGAGRAAQALY